MDKKEEEIIKEIIHCQNYLGMPVFMEDEQRILSDLYLNEDISLEDVCLKYRINYEYLAEITRTYENVENELYESKKRIKK